MHEILTVQLGHSANYVATHFWNTQVCGLNALTPQFFVIYPHKQPSRYYIYRGTIYHRNGSTDACLTLASTAIIFYV